MSHRPYLTDELPGIGGELKVEPEDFRVVEEPLYPRSGEGQHLYVEIEKRGLNSTEAIERLARRFGFDKRDVGMAGMKDRHAVTRQWLSLPAHLMATLDVVGSVDDQLDILRAELHGNKLRTGHLAGNHFRIIVRNTEVDADVALQRATDLLGVIASTGAPNYFGMQRFGRGGSTVELGLGLLRQDKGAKNSVRRKRRLKKLAFNAVQSAIFNGILARRIEQETVADPMMGDRVEWHDERRYLRLDDEDELETGRAAVEAGDASISGPLPGPRHPVAAGSPRDLELEVYDEWGVDDETFSVAGKLALGTRRPFTVPVRDASAEIDAEGQLALAFFLPSGSYATVVLRELMKDES